MLASIWLELTYSKCLMSIIVVFGGAVFDALIFIQIKLVFTQNTNNLLILVIMVCYDISKIITINAYFAINRTLSA